MDESAIVIQSTLMFTTIALSNLIFSLRTTHCRLLLPSTKKFLNRNKGFLYSRLLRKDKWWQGSFSLSLSQFRGVFRGGGGSRSLASNQDFHKEWKREMMIGKGENLRDFLAHFVPTLKPDFWIRACSVHSSAPTILVGVLLINGYTMLYLFLNTVKL